MAVSNATRILHILSGLDIFQDPVGQVWATIPVNGAVEYVPIKGQYFRSWVASGFFKATGQTAGATAIENAVNVLMQSAYEKPARRVFVRVAHNDGKIFVDLANERREVVEIDVKGWKVITNPPVAFRRPRGMLALPTPKEYGDLKEIGLFSNLRDETDLTLLVGWIVGAVGNVGYPVLVLNGSQGSGKSTLAIALKRLLDPNEADTRSLPRDEQTLAIAASNQWVLSLDNLSTIPDWLSDSLCRLSTGTGWGTRELYADTDEVILKIKRPIIVNGITNLVIRGDLLDRSIIINLPEISDVQRRTEAEFWASFENSKPYFLGAICDAASTALARWDISRLDSYPRLADFTRWVEAAALSLNWEWGKFAMTFSDHAEVQSTIAIDLSVIGSELVTFAQNKKNWIGSATQLLEQLQSQTYATPSFERFSKMTPRALSDEIRRLAPLLRKQGIDISTSDKTRWVNGVAMRPIEICLLSIGQRVNVP